jgi:hypothetical protein
VLLWKEGDRAVSAMKLTGSRSLGVAPFVVTEQPFLRWALRWWCCCQPQTELMCAQHVPSPPCRPGHVSSFVRIKGLANVLHGKRGMYSWIDLSSV